MSEQIKDRSSWAGFPSVRGNLVSAPEGRWTIYTSESIEILEAERVRARETGKECLLCHQFQFFEHDYVIPLDDFGSYLDRVFMRSPGSGLYYEELTGDKLARAFRELVKDLRDVSEGWALWKAGVPA